MTGIAPARLRCDGFGIMPDRRAIERYTLTNGVGMELALITYGGTVVSLKVPDRAGVLGDVTPGFDTLEPYLADTRYLGSLVGRVANRVAGARFELDAAAYALDANEGEHHLHGGAGGLHSVVWSAHPIDIPRGVGVELRYLSPNGEQGYPGNLDVRVVVTLDDDCAATFTYTATTDRPTPVNLTQHSYFNLAGARCDTLGGHELTVRASRFLPVDESLVPNGEIRSVAGTPFDFRVPRELAASLSDAHEQLARAGGYDHTLVLDARRSALPSIAAQLHEPRTGRLLTVETTEPGLHLYTGNRLDAGAAGKGGHRYRAHGAVALETQHFPNSPNETAFPGVILRPASVYESTTVYRFSVR